MLSLLGLETYQAQKLTLQDSLQISFDSMKNWAPQVPKDLPWQRVSLGPSSVEYLSR